MPPSQGRGLGSEAGSGPEILAPEDTGVYDADVESPFQRRRRLEESGIVAPPPERKRVLSTYERVADALRPATEDATGEPLPIGLRFDGNFGSWFALKAPAQTRYVPDFSYGLSVLFPLGQLPKDEEGRSRTYFIGPAAIFYNGGTIQKHPDSYGGRTDVYADTNVTEAGADLLLAQEMRLSRFTVFSAEARLSYAPLRQVRAVYDTGRQTPGRSEVGSHTRFNWSGVGLGVSGVVYVARAVGAGPFVSVSLASPPQAKLRVGFQVAFTSTAPAPAMATPAPEDPTRPSPVLKGTRFDKPVLESTPIPETPTPATIRREAPP